MCDGWNTVYVDPEDGSHGGICSIILDRQGPKARLIHRGQHPKIKATDLWARDIMFSVIVWRGSMLSPVWVGGWDEVWVPTVNGVATRDAMLRRGSDFSKRLRRGRYRVEVTCWDDAMNAGGCRGYDLYVK